MLQATTLKFLQNLKKNNNKEWFDQNRKQYDAAKSDFAALVDTVILQFGKKKHPYLASLQKIVFIELIEMSVLVKTKLLIKIIWEQVLLLAVKRVF